MTGFKFDPRPIGITGNHLGHMVDTKIERRVRTANICLGKVPPPVLRKLKGLNESCERMWCQPPIHPFGLGLISYGNAEPLRRLGRQRVSIDGLCS